MYHSAYEAEARIYWNTVEEASSYEVYKVNADGASSLIMETTIRKHTKRSILRMFV